jgi:hypothetical protein
VIEDHLGPAEEVDQPVELREFGPELIFLVLIALFDHQHLAPAFARVVRAMHGVRFKLLAYSLERSSKLNRLTAPILAAGCMISGQLTR